MASTQVTLGRWPDICAMLREGDQPYEQQNVLLWSFSSQVSARIWERESAAFTHASLFKLPRYLPGMNSNMHASAPFDKGA